MNTNSDNNSNMRMKGNMTKNLLKIIVYFIFLLIAFAPVMKVGAIIPVTYTCCYDYSYNNGTPLESFDNEDVPGSGIQLDNFENLSNWTVGPGGSQQADTLNFKEGTQGLELIATNGNRAYTDKIINNDFSNTNNFAIWIYVYDANTYYYSTIYFTSTGSAWSRYFVTASSSVLVNGWNKLVFDKRNFLNSGGEDWNNTMNMVRIATYPITGQSTNTTLGDLRYDISGNWTVGGTGASEQADTINFKEGAQGLKLITINGSSGFTDRVINSDFSNTSNFAVWVYVDNASNSSFVRLYMTSAGDNWTTYFLDSEYGGVETGWNKLVFNKNSFTNVGGENWHNTMNRMRLRIGPYDMENVNVTFDDLRDNMGGQRAKLMIDFDDGLPSAYTNAYPILKANNQTATSFVVTSFVGVPSAGSMTLSNLRTLQNARWDISSHTVDHPHLETLGDAALSSELNDSYAWLVANKFQKSAVFIAYPYGGLSDAVIDKTKKRYVLGRGTILDSAQQHFANTGDDSIRYIERIIGVVNTSSVQSVKDKINDTINSKLLGILLFHDIVTTYPANPDPDSYLKADFQTISNYIKSRSSDVDVITRSDYVIPNINSFTPVINKTTRIYSNGTAVLITDNMFDEYMPNMTVTPSSGSIDVGITNYSESTGNVSFNESNSSSNVTYDIGDRLPIMIYNVKIYFANGTLYQNFNIMANNTGYISYNSPGFGGSRYQKIGFVGALDTTFTVSLPVGYTFLRFNASNSTVTNLNPDGQNSSQPMFNITNNGNINQSFMLKISDVIKNITTYGDLSNNFSQGKIEINTSSAILIPSLIPGQRQNLWIIIDTKNAPVMNKNVTLTINSRNSS